MAIGYNPALRRLNKMSGTEELTEERRASYKGVAIKTIFFALLTFLAAVISVLAIYATLQPTADGVSIVANEDAFMSTILIVIIGGAILTFVGMIGSIFSKKGTTLAVFGSLYAIGQGMSLGFLSGIAELLVSGIVVSALLSTFVVFGVMSLLFFTGAIKVGEKFRSAMRSILISVLLFSLLFLLASFFLPSFVSMWATSPMFGWLSIAVSVIMIIIASLMILYNLSTIQQAVDNGLEKQYEWFGAFGLTVTLIWLYTEFLRLFLKIAILFGKKR